MKRYLIIAISVFALIMLVILLRFRPYPLLAYILYGIDKLAAVYQWQRVPEKLLHFLALSGGSPMALLAQQIFNHKTSKRSFLAAYWLIVAVQLGLLYAVFYTDFLKQIF